MIASENRADVSGPDTLENPRPAEESAGAEPSGVAEQAPADAVPAGDAALSTALNRHCRGTFVELAMRYQSTHVDAVES